MSSNNRSQSETNIAKAAHQAAQNNGQENISVAANNVRAGMNSGNVRTITQAQTLANGVIRDLLLLCLYQEVELPNIWDTIKLYRSAYDGHIANGNTKNYIESLETGITEYDLALFVPENVIPSKVTSDTLDFYQNVAGNSNGSGNRPLNTAGGAYQFKKELTVLKQEWQQYFISGNLSKMVALKVEELQRAYDIYMFNKWCEIVTDVTPTSTQEPYTSRSGKIVTSTANNLYDAVIELFYHIDKMTQYNSEYNSLQNNALLTYAKPENLKIFCSTKVRNYLENGIKSQLFNTQFFGTHDKSISNNNIVVLGNKITQAKPSTSSSNDRLTAQTTVNVDTKQEWLDDNTIIVVDISKIKHVTFWDNLGTQDWEKNASSYFTKDIWGVMKILPWAKKLVFKMPQVNMTTASRANDTQVVEESGN